VAAKIIVPFNGTDDVRVDDRAWETVAGTIGTEFVVAINGEEYHLMVLANDHKGNRGVEAQFFARLSNERQLFINNSLELTLRDAVCGQCIR